MAVLAAQTATAATSDSAATAHPAGASTNGGSIAQTWPAAKLSLNPGTGESKASFQNQTTAGLRGADADRLRAALGEERGNKLKKKKELEGVCVEVEQHGNALTLKRLSST